MRGKIMAEPDLKENNDSTPSFFWPVFLVAIGSVLLLNNLNIIPWSSWENLVKFWPMLLILWGLEMLLGGGKLANLVVTVIGVSLLVLILGSYVPQLGQLIISLFPGIDLNFFQSRLNGN